MRKRFLKGLNFKGKEVKMMKRGLIVFLASVVSILILSIPSANATLVIIDDWTLYTGTKYIDAIDFMNYTGISHVNSTDADLSGGLSVDDPFTDVAIFKISPGDFENDSTGTISKYRDATPIGVSDFELTGIASMTGYHTSVLGDDVDYAFTSATLGLYLDTTPDAAPGLGGTTVSGYKDGTQIASFTLLSGSGNFDFGDGDGNIDIDFSSSWVLAGYMFTKGGQDFSTISFLAALTDSNSDKTNNTWPTNWSSYTGQAIGTDLFDLNLEIDGSARYAVPEPATMLLFGTGLIGLAGAARRKLGKKK